MDSFKCSWIVITLLLLHNVCVCVFLCISGGLWQGIDRSHSWVNSAYAPGGSRSVLRRNPNSSCDLKQVPNPSPIFHLLTVLTIITSSQGLSVCLSVCPPLILPANSYLSLFYQVATPCSDLSKRLDSLDLIFSEWHKLCLGFVRSLSSLALITAHRVLTGHLFHHSSIFTSLCPHFYVHRTITPCQANDCTSNRMSAFLDSVALFSVPTRQIAKKVKLKKHSEYICPNIHTPSLTFFDIHYKYVRK